MVETTRGNSTEPCRITFVFDVAIDELEFDKVPGLRVVGSPTCSADGSRVLRAVVDRYDPNPK